MILGELMAELAHAPVIPQHITAIATPRYHVIDLFDGIAALFAASTTSSFDFPLCPVRSGWSQIHFPHLIKYALI